MKSFSLLTIPGQDLKITKGVKISFENKKPYIQLPEITGVENKKKFKVQMDKDNSFTPEIVSGKIYDIFLKKMGGNFSSPNGSLLAQKDRNENKNIIIFSWQRFIFSGEGKNCTQELGSSDGSLGTGIMVLKPLNSIFYFHNGKKYRLVNLNGELVKTLRETIIIKKQQKVA